eukprot:TRINITY_DN31956_c0_g1_i1.p1 TRINITY_DN31956_c0_g1~~TRINITY_DN31956_c0_g1_i1.p1  ORF type:complete len:263 (-),score=32.63 TRINITY_DN31956_c0_g1_i1:216-1004(-)
MLVSCQQLLSRQLLRHMGWQISKRKCCLRPAGAASRPRYVSVQLPDEEPPVLNVTIAQIIQYVHSEINGSLDSVEGKAKSFASILLQHDDISLDTLLPLADAVLVVEEIGASPHHLLPFLGSHPDPNERDPYEEATRQSQCHKELVNSRLSKVARGGPSQKLFTELRKRGLRIGGGRGCHIYGRSGAKHVLRQTCWDDATDVPKLLDFVQTESWDGMYCERCSFWFATDEIQQAETRGSDGYAPQSQCLGTCPQALSWALKK